ncbi:thiamine biosynthesis protein ThiJ [Rhizobiales bacterium RZME27]|uniref:Thiamine biosynthesis protein ThiJ n=1 Tax=Endobacterium cereale TaxID=2663029 RepID=A0A6A8AC69_9HYPH|nr:DJ-1/PfpI family protein [Endobacterium cereale]MEB2845621.1 DJ-1/PfpI family protein [Endobacterium cereale]MQY48752.1 thiamine biosynthesis protein ThiJ [Endobacterium cereale]
MKKRFIVPLAIIAIFSTAIVWMNAPAPGNIGSTSDKTPTLTIPEANGRRPLVLLLAENDGTETTDLIVPFGILKQADIADVVIAATKAGPVTLMPALTIEPDITLQDFMARYEHRPDVIIVPAYHHAANPIIENFVAEQARAGKTIVSICDGALTVARTGIFDHRRATGHWFSLRGLASDFPDTQWITNRRFVTDGPIMSTTGVSASIPASLFLVEQLSDRVTAERTARKLGLPMWSDAHLSENFRLTAGRITAVASNAAAFWLHETISIPAQDGFDEIALALQADAWSRTYRSQAIVRGNGVITSRNGLKLLPTDMQADVKMPAETSLAGILHSIGKRYGAATADLVALQLEADP